jgi:hypothetical protein
MVRKVTSLTFDLFGRDRTASKTMKGVGNQAGKLGDTLNKVGVGIGVAFAAGAAAIVAAGVQAFESLKRIETIGAQTEAAIKSTGGAANVTAEQVRALADSLERTTATESEAIQEGANLLLTFTNIRNGVGATEKVFDRATELMVDMARAMGTDVSSGAIQLGKALNDPVAGITSLTRAGVQFTDEQKNMIEALVESGDLMGAQQVILNELETQFGGSGEAYAATLAGQMDTLNHNLGGVAESIVLSLMPAFEEFIAYANSDLVPWLEDFAAWFVDDAVPAIEGFVSKLEEMAEDGTLVPAVVGGLVAITGAQWGLNAALSANPIGLVILAIAALAAQVTYVVTMWEDFKVSAEDDNWSIAIRAMFGGWAGIIATFVQNWDMLWYNLSSNFTIQINGMISAINFLLAPLQAVLDVINRIAGTNFNIRIPKVDYPRVPGAPSTQRAADASQIVTGFRAMAEGGLVRATPGGMPAIIGEGQYDELVTPLSPQMRGMFGGGDTYNVTIRGIVAGSRTEMAKEVVRAIEDAKKLGDIPRSALTNA